MAIQGADEQGSIDHDCVLGDQSWVGIGASIRQGVVVGPAVMIAAGAAVVEDIADNLTVAGVPAKALMR